ncbi:tRNA lysidine(34) synthetase TilS [Erythrobacter sp. QSSC1-22B]|uniref:tRNA lysidine(34) synthetase TilS n=1 Tax=Erythrobacter sp. QSSC1-22B TaxID=1860125 RepID=UPI00143C987B|nr:tRNA lysidine(34) synthetase TilS [Erythrobacter sp. QSSC1-22B]
MAVSGGPDSVALLLLAHAARPEILEAATVDHGLRPESAAEAQWVAQLCRTLDVPHRTVRVDVEAGNLQSRAREARYQALDRWTDERRLSAVATAHHADDQAETLLMRLNRGSGLPGLAGVRSSAIVPGGKGRLLRPLLGWRKAELEALVRGAGLEPVADPSNRDTRFDRVRVREALAAADWIDPLALARSAALLGEAEATLEELVAESYSRQVTRENGCFHFTVSRTDYIRVEVVGRIFAEMGFAPPRSEIARLVARLGSGANASLAGVLGVPSNENGIACWTFRPEPPRRQD